MERLVNTVKEVIRIESELERNMCELESMKREITRSKLKTNKMKTESFAYGVLATSLAVGAALTPATAGLFGVVGLVYTTGCAAISVRVAIRSYKKTKKFKKSIKQFLCERDAKVKEFLKEFNKFWASISETDQFKKLQAQYGVSFGDDGVSFRDDKESNQSCILNFLSKLKENFKEVSEKHKKKLLGASICKDAVKVSKKIFDLVDDTATAAAPVIRETSTVIGSKSSVVFKGATTSKTVVTSTTSTIGHVFAGIGVVFTIVDLGFLIRDWRRWKLGKHGKIKEIDKTIKQLEREKSYFEELAKVIEGIEYVDYDEEM
jgi:predicted tellurium resistance membrane protein TerC